MKKPTIRKSISVLLSLLMVLSVFGMTAFAAPPGSGDSGIGGTGIGGTGIDIDDAVQINFNADNAEITWSDSCSDVGYWDILASDGATYYIELSNDYSEQAAGTYAWDDMDEKYCYIGFYENGYTDYTDFLVDGSCTVTVDGDVVTLSGTFTGESGTTYVITITTGSELTAEEEAEALEAAKTDAENALDAYVNADDYRANEQADLADAIAAGKEAIENAETIDDVEAALEAAKGVIDDIPTDAELTEQELATAKTDAKADLDTLLASKTEADYDADDWAALTQAIADGKTNIDAATSTDDVAAAKTDAVNAVNAIKTTAEKAEEELAAAALAAAKEQLSAAIDDAKAFYNTIKDEEAYADVADTLDTVIQQGEAMLNSDDAAEILAKAEQVAAAAAAAAEQKDAIDAAAAAALADAKAQLAAAVADAEAYYDSIKDEYPEIASDLYTNYGMAARAMNSDDADEVLGAVGNVEFAVEEAKKAVANAAQTEEPTTPDEPTTSDDDNNSQTFKGDFFRKLFAWLIELFNMFTRWVQK